MNSTKTKAPGGRPGRLRRHEGKQKSFQDNSTPIFVGSQAIGRVQGDTFYKNIRGSRHMLRKPKAIAFDVSSLYDAQRAGAVRAEITDTETGRVYVARIDDILRDGKRFNRGYGWQIYFLLSRWRTPDAPEQMSIFDIPEIGEARQSLATATLPLGYSSRKTFDDQRTLGTQKPKRH